MKRLVLEPEHEAFRETVKQFIERELVPNAEQWENDRLVDRSAFVAAGNRAELAIYPGGAHAFNYFPIAISEQANARMDAFLKRETA